MFSQVCVSSGRGGEGRGGREKEDEGYPMGKYPSPPSLSPSIPPRLSDYPAGSTPLAVSYEDFLATSGIFITGAISSCV